MILKAQGISKSYGKNKILSAISLTVAPGQSIAICGRSGEGKTTLLHILGTLEEPTVGQIEVAGQILTRSNAPQLRNQHIGFVFQSYNLLEDFTTLENVLMPSLIGRKAVDREKGLQLLAQVGLESRADFPAKLLSGGERQRAAIARALCNNPDLILADEPSGNLDRANAQNIGQILLSLVKEQNKSLILVTHDVELASLCDRRYTLSDGELKPC